MSTLDRAALIDKTAKCPCDCHTAPDLDHGHATEECPCRPMWIRVDSVLNRALIEYGLHESRFSAGIRDSILALFATSRPVIAKALLAPLRELHKPVHLTFSWNSGVRAEAPCETCGGKAGTHECGCWGDLDRLVFCEACSAASEFKHSVASPCPTVRLLDAIELEAGA